MSEFAITFQAVLATVAHLDHPVLQVVKVVTVVWDNLVNQENLATKLRRTRAFWNAMPNNARALLHLEIKELLVAKALTDLPEMLVPPVLMASLETKDLVDHPVKLANPVHPDKRDHPDHLAMLCPKLDHPAQLVDPVVLVLPVLLANPEAQAKTDQPVNLVLLVKLDHLAMAENPDQSVPMEMLANKVKHNLL